MADVKFFVLFSDKSFRNWNSLRSHERTHDSARPFSCEKCGAAFKQKSQLRGHMQIHLGMIANSLIKYLESYL